MANDDGGPAFPHGRYMKNPATGAFDTYAHGGMSLRDYFAGQVIMGITANSFIAGNNHRTDLIGSAYFRTLSEHAYMMADAMIAARNEGN